QQSLPNKLNDEQSVFNRSVGTFPTDTRPLQASLRIRQPIILLRIEIKDGGVDDPVLEINLLTLVVRPSPRNLFLQERNVEASRILAGGVDFVPLLLFVEGVVILGQPVGELVHEATERDYIVVVAGFGDFLEDFAVQGEGVWIATIHTLL